MCLHGEHTNAVVLTRKVRTPRIAQGHLAAHANNERRSVRTAHENNKRDNTGGRGRARRAAYQRNVGVAH